MTPIGRPAPPAKPTVEALDGAVRVGIAPEAPGVARYRFECSGDGGATWPDAIDAPPGDQAEIGHLTNGTDYTCRAFAANTTGVSDASPLSDAVRPCGGGFQCNPLLLPVLGGLGAILAGLVLVAVFFLVSQPDDRTRRGGRRRDPHRERRPRLEPGDRVRAGARDPDRDRDRRRIAGGRRTSGSGGSRGGRFAVRDRTGRHVVEDGAAVVVVDSMGVRHSLVLQAFATNAASEVASRR